MAACHNAEFKMSHCNTHLTQFGFIHLFGLYCYKLGTLSLAHVSVCVHMVQSGKTCRHCSSAMPKSLSFRQLTEREFPLLLLLLSRTKYNKCDQIYRLLTLFSAVKQVNLLPIKQQQKLNHLITLHSGWRALILLLTFLLKVDSAADE